MAPLASIDFSKLLLNFPQNEMVPVFYVFILAWSKVVSMGGTFKPSIRIDFVRYGLHGIFLCSNYTVFKI